MKSTPIQHLSRMGLKPYLEGCGYQRSLIDSNVRLPGNGRTALAAFAHAPRDSRSACIAAVDGFTDPHQDVVACRALGTPMILVCFPDELQWWVTGTTETSVRERVPASKVEEFFEHHRKTFAPNAIYRAKTLGRFDPNNQLDFVDIGLMPLIEAEAGRKLQELLERVVQKSRNSLGWENISEAQGHWLLKANFWLLAAKILQDKDVEPFVDLNLSDLDTVYARLASHYGAGEAVQAGSKSKRKALVESAREIARFSQLGLVSMEALAYLYESALITKETRAELGTHSTPAYLVDYIVGRLRPWIEETDWKQQRVFEPACGHAAFTLAAMRVLSELLPSNLSTPARRHQYLRQRLHGCDRDPFALEIARLSLTLADVPNPNGWDLRLANMFEGDVLAEGARNASLVLANPPFENFEAAEKAELDRRGAKPEFNNKAVEMVWRLASNMSPGAVLGLVLPQGILHSKNAAPVRRLLASDFEIREICLFPDKVFTFSDAESAVIMARRVARFASNRIAYRRVKETEMDNFMRTFHPTGATPVPQAYLLESDSCNFLVPELFEVWEHCKEYTRLGSIAEVGKGFEHRSTSDPRFPRGEVTELQQRRNGYVRGFARLGESLLTHELPEPVWLNLDSRVIRSPGHGASTGVPQVLLNYARVSRGPWRLKAFLDRDGHPVTSRFLVVRPLQRRYELEVLWAICNSPLANAYSYAFSGKRDILTGLMRELPLPRLEGVNVQHLIRLVHSYFEATKSTRGKNPDAAEREWLRILHWRIDAEVLRLYDLPTPLEYKMLMLFSGESRRGVPFEQTEYVPKVFTYPISLRDILAITSDWERINDRRSHLILKEERNDLIKGEAEELAHLQYLTDLRIQLVTPLPLVELEHIAADLKRKGLWVEDLAELA